MLQTDTRVWGFSCTVGHVFLIHHLPELTVLDFTTSTAVSVGSIFESMKIYRTRSCGTVYKQNYVTVYRI